MIKRKVEQKKKDEIHRREQENNMGNMHSWALTDCP